MGSHVKLWSIDPTPTDDDDDTSRIRHDASRPPGRTGPGRPPGRPPKPEGRAALARNTQQAFRVVWWAARVFAEVVVEWLDQEAGRSAGRSTSSYDHAGLGGEIMIDLRRCLNKTIATTR